MPMLPSLPRVGDDRRVDADHFAAHVEQRTARVARVDRGVGLHHVVGAAVGDRERRASVALITPIVTVCA